MKLAAKNLFKLGSLFLSAALTTPTSAQSISNVSAPYGIVNTPAWFVVTGNGFPTDVSAELGMKFAVNPPDVCQQAQRTAAITANRYEFSCVFTKPTASAGFTVFNKSTRNITRLWKGEIQILADHPQITGIYVHTPGITPGQLRVQCTDPKICLSIVEPWFTEGTLLIEVSGNNLPKSLHLEWPHCSTTDTTNNLLDQNSRIFQCVKSPSPNLPDSKAATMKILTSTRAEDARILFSADLQR